MLKFHSQFAHFMLGNFTFPHQSLRYYEIRIFLAKGEALV